MDYPLLAIATGQIVAAVLTSWGQKVGFVPHLTPSFAPSMAEMVILWDIAKSFCVFQSTKNCCVPFH